MKFIFYSLCTLWSLLSNNLNAQHFSFGTSHVGIGFGSFTKYYGINFSLKNKSNQLNGIGFTFLGSPNARVNGFNIGLIQNASKVSGLNLGFLFCQTKHLNGLSFSLITLSDSTNGISIGGFLNASKVQRGISISGFLNLANRSEGISIGLGNICSSGKGLLQIGIYNCVDYRNGDLSKRQYTGVQIGLINKIVSNRKLFRVLPFINFNFRKLPPVLKPQPIEKRHADSLIAKNSSTMTDLRDGKIYHTIQIGKQTWMAQNLAYAPTVDSLFSAYSYTHKGIYMRSGKDYKDYISPNARKIPPRTYCYNDATIFCEKYGMLYTYESAKKACPVGWRLPTEMEFDTLLSIVARDGDILYAYEALLANGSSGFRALLAGSMYVWEHGYGSYSGFGNDTGFWSSTRVNSWGAKVLSLGKNYSGINKEAKINAYYVRCVKD